VSSRGRAFVVFGIILLVVAFGTGNRIMLLTALLLAAMLIIATIVVRVRRLKIGAQRTFRPATVEVGGTAEVTLLVSNLASRRSPAAFWRDTLPWAPGYTVDSVLAPLDGKRARQTSKSIVKLEYEVHPNRRGLFEIGPLSIESGDPFGLVVGSVDLRETHTLVVTPRVYDLPGAGLMLDAGSGSSTVTQRSSNGSEDDLMTREYRRGDALRRVHWRASARHGELMVRQEEPRSRPETRIIIDTRVDGYDSGFPFGLSADDQGAESATFEWIVSFVASVGEHLHNAGYVVTVLERLARSSSNPAQTEGWMPRPTLFSRASPRCDWCAISKTCMRNRQACSDPRQPSRPCLPCSRARARQPSSGCCTSAVRMKSAPRSSSTAPTNSPSASTRPAGTSCG